MDPEPTQICTATTGALASGLIRHTMPLSSTTRRRGLFDSRKTSRVPAEAFFIKGDRIKHAQMSAVRVLMELRIRLVASANSGLRHALPEFDGAAETAL